MAHSSRDRWLEAPPHILTREEKDAIFRSLLAFIRHHHSLHGKELCYHIAYGMTLVACFLFCLLITAFDVFHIV